MAEIERDEEEISPPTLSIDADKGKGKEKEGEGEGKTTTPPGSPRPTKRKRARESNPNAEALKDVARFTLADDPAPGQGRRKVPERYYYTKPRSVPLCPCSHYTVYDKPEQELILDLDSRISWIQCRNSTKCTFTRWEPGLMQMRFVKSLIPVGESLEIGS